jgi:DNA-directed RNA polymerase alpha subunit
MPTNNNTPKLRELLNYLSEEQCAWAIGVLRQRLQQIKQVEKVTSPDAPIETLGLSVRACNALHSNKLYTIRDVLTYGLDRLHLLRYTGAKTADEIRTAILRHESQSDARPEGARMNVLEPSAG